MIGFFIQHFMFILVVITILILCILWKKIYASHDKFNNVVMALCAVFSIVWAGYTFDALHQRDKAQADLIEIQNKIKSTESTFFSIDVNQYQSGKTYFINPVVKIKNSGTDAIFVKLNKQSMTVSKIDTMGDKVIAKQVLHPNYYEVISSDKSITNTPIYDMSVPISAERTLSYLVSVTEPGMYYVTFSSVAMSSDGKVVKKTLNGKNMIWFSSAYVMVKPNY